jgi:hypothetical protein
VKLNISRDEWKLYSMLLKDWLRKTRSLRHDIYEVMMWVVGIGLVIYYVIK